MGTSSLYHGLKKAILLPSDYVEGDGSTPEVLPIETPEEQPVPEAQPTIGGAKNSLTRSMGNEKHTRRAIRTYVSALGGHEKATKQIRAARKVTTKMVVMFSGGLATIKTQLEAQGVQVEHKTIKEICREICCSLLLPGATREDSVANCALIETFETFAENEGIADLTWENLTESLLVKLECLFITNAIVSKLLNDASLGMIRKAQSTLDYLKAEKDIKDIVSDVVELHAPEYLNQANTSNDVEQLVHDLYDKCYQILEN